MGSRKLPIFIALTMIISAVPAAAEKPTPFAMAEADLAAETDGTARMVIDPATSRARLIQFPAGSIQIKGANPIEKAGRFLARYGELLGVQDATQDLELVRSDSDQMGMTHLVFRQSHADVPVFGAELRVHLDPGGEIVTVNGTLVPDLTLDTSPTISWDLAESRARTLLAKENGLSANDLSFFGADLMIYRSGLTRGIPGQNHLTWKVEVGFGHRLRELFFIDAHGGQLIDRIDQIHTIERRVYHRNTDTTLWNEGDALPYSGLTSAKDAEVNDLIQSAQETYDLFFNISGGSYLSYNGNDIAMRSIYESDSLSGSCPNAQWNGRTTDYCEGMAVDDVIAHEWTHAYTRANHDLIYAWQPGALNESYSDIFGEIVDMTNGRGLDDPSPPRAANGCSSSGGIRMPPALEVTAPASAAGPYATGGATWNPAVWSVSGTVELVDDGTETATDACEALTGFTEGRVALIDRGTCSFATKAINAQDAGAIAIIVANNEDDGLYTMTASDPIPEIPGVFIDLSDGQTLKSVEGQGLHVEMEMDSPMEDSVRWLVAEDTSINAFRDMWNPNCFRDPGAVNDINYWCGSGDNGGVHINSGISNHAFALLVDGGTFRGESIAPIGMTKAAHIYWRAMTVYQGPTTDYPEHADLMELSCSDLIGQPITSLTTGGAIGDTIDATDCEQVAKAMSAVGMRAAPSCDFNVILDPDPPALPTGQQVFFEGFSGPPGTEWTISSEGVYPEHNPALTDWQWTNDVPDGGDGGSMWAIDSYFIGNCEPNDDDQSGVTRLESPTIDIPTSASGAILVFDHWVATEDGWDGGNLRISVNGADYQVVPAGAFLYNPYNSAVIDEIIIDEQLLTNTNPLAGEPAYTGEDEGHVFGGSWGQSQVDLDFFAGPGDSVRLRWDFGIDGCNGFVGWYVDNVQVIAEGATQLSVRRPSGRRVIPAGSF
jgi:Zn-dependent metalloprotease